MRMMMKVTIPVEAANELLRSASMSATIQKLILPMSPEAVYFTNCGGQRTVYVIFDMAENSDLAKHSEPWFLTLGAAVEVAPVMTPEDVDSLGAKMIETVKKFG